MELEYVRQLKGENVPDDNPTENSLSTREWDEGGVARRWGHLDYAILERVNEAGYGLSTAPISNVVE